VELVTARCPDHPELRAMLVRPDGHVAWLATSDEQVDGLREALDQWHGLAERPAA
jgi:hypothetical protein